jgi:adenylosuccinate synthase
MRSERCVTADHVWRNIDPHESGVFLCEVPYLLTSARSVLLEGTQGTGLSLTTGYFPYVTSRNTTVAGLCADAGIAPQRVDRTILVIRTFPIRVAGNSGPFAPGSFETSWEFLGVDPESQRTSVTKLIRRVASFSMQQVVEAVNLNGATEIALTFCDYLDPDGRGVDAVVDSIELATDIPVRYLGYGPHTIIDRGK